MATIAELVVTLRANSAQFTSAIERAERRSRTFGRNVESTFGQLAKATAIMATTVASSFVVMMKRSIETADHLGKLSQQTGISTESLSALAYGAELANISVEAFEKGLMRAARSTNAAASGVEKSKAAFDSLRITVKNSDGTLRSTEAVISDVAEAFSHMEDGPQKTALSMEIFGKSGARLIPLLNEGRAGLVAYREEAEQLGLVVSKKTAQDAQRFNDALKRVGKVVEGLFVRLQGELGPLMADLAEDFVRAARGSESLSTALSGVTWFMKGLTLEAVIAKNTLDITGKTLAFMAAAWIELARETPEQSRLAAVAAMWKEFKSDVAGDVQDVQNMLDRLAGLRQQQVHGVIFGPAKIAPVVEDESAKKKAEKAAADAIKRNQRIQDAVERQRQRFLQRQQEAAEDIGFLVKDLANEEEQIRLSAERRLKIIENALNLEQLSEERAAELRKVIREKEAEELQQRRFEQFGEFRAATTAILGLDKATGIQRVSAAFEVADQLAGAFSAGSKKAFEAQKALAIAEATIRSFVAIQQALSEPGLPTIAKFALAAAIGALTVANVARIKAQQYTPRRQGGPVQPGRVFSVGEEDRPELLLIPGNRGRVFSNSEVQRIQGGGGGETNVVVNIHGAPAGADVRQRRARDGSLELDVILERVDTAMARGLERGDSRTARSMQRVFGVSRAAGAR